MIIIVKIRHNLLFITANKLLQLRECPFLSTNDIWVSAIDAIDAKCFFRESFANIRANHK